VKALSILSFAVLALVARAGAQSIVYDNTTTSLDNNFPLLPEWMDESAEAGDEVQLGGADREIVKLDLLFTYRGTVPGTLDALVRFRAYDEAFQGPGQTFYESSLTQVQTLPGIHQLTFNVPHVVVPDHFVWTIQLFNRQGSVGEIGPSYYNPPTVGSSGDFLWQRGGNEWTAYSWGGDPYANFGARFTAVPEPATMGILAFGALFACRRARRLGK